MVLAKPRHDEVIKQMHNLGIRVMAIPDGDVAASVLCCLPDAEVDMVYGIGGAPEGVAAGRCNSSIRWRYASSSYSTQ